MATGQSDVARAIQAASDEYCRLFNAGQADQLAQAYYSEDARLLPPNHPMASGRSQVRDALQSFMDAGLGELTLEAVQVDASGDFAYRVGTYSLGKPAPDTGKFIEIHRRQPDGSWKCIADIFNSDQAAT